MVRDAKGAKDRVTMLPRSMVELLKRQLAVAKAMVYTHVLNRGGRGVASPLDLATRRD